MTTHSRWLASVVGAAATALTVASGRPVAADIRSGASDQAGLTQTVDITAERFSFTPSEVRVKSGTRLELRLHSDDTDHGFQIPGTDINVRIPKRNRGTTTVTFDAVKPGRHAFQCSHVCGAGHSFMRGEIVVTE
jgi:cytochrome c oxidase subunit 2